ncbi:MAG: putative transporter [bacterium]|nr:putative transporter [bacterium]MDD6833405.1 putative transporter [bacterium]MDD6901710.1 putative transporter [bacterium]MDY4184919.1 putative transporter [Sodaliphilus sp.]
MNWLFDLFAGSTIAHALFVYSIVIAIGVILGKVKFLGISLGATFVLFVGILMGHIGNLISPDEAFINHNTLKFIQEFGLILFVFSIGLQVGPSFFSTIKDGGMLLNGLAVCIILLNIVVALAIYFGIGGVAPNEIVGILSGAVTNTPGLGAAQQALIETQGDAAGALNESMAMGYAAAYPLGVVGIILSIILVKVIFKVNIKHDAKEIEDDNANSLLKPHVVTYKVTNKLIFDRSIKRLHDIMDRNFVISRLKKHDGEIVIPVADTIVSEGDLLRVVISEQDEEVFDAVIGPKVEFDWKEEQTPVVSRRIVVTNSEFSGRKLGSLRLPKGYGLNATRVNRAGLDLLASPNLSLHVGDRITVVGQLEDINRLAQRLGNSMKRLDHPNMFTIFIGIFMGIVLGSIPFALPGMSVPMKLGLAGGPLVAAILIGRYGHKIKLVTYTSSSANLMLRELGICLFLASVGLAAGANFANTVFNGTGAKWVLYGFLITFIPLIVVGCVARAKFKLNYCTLMGLISGSTTDPPALAYANKTAGNDAPAVAYSTVYPLTMFLRVVTAQVIVMMLI